MNLIAAVDPSWGIGKDNDLLYHVPEDMKFFREKTVENFVICGRRTLESFPGSKPLPNRKHFVLTGSSLEENDFLVKVGDLEELYRLISDLPSERVFVIGGASVYRQLYKKCKKAYITKILCSDVKADVFFPDLDKDPDFRLVEESEVLTSKNGLKYSFLTYENINL